MFSKLVKKKVSFSEWLDYDKSHLSYKAQGIWAFLLSISPDYENYAGNDLLKCGASDGEGSIKSGLKELKDAGILTVTQERRKNGTIEGSTWTVWGHSA